MVIFIIHARSIFAGPYEAKKQYKEFGESDVTPEMNVQELHVCGMAQAVGARVANVQAIVITPKGQREPGKAIRPMACGSAVVVRLT